MKMKSLQNKLFVVRKYVWATDAQDAIKKDKSKSVDDVWIDEEWKKAPKVDGQLGFYNAKK